DQPGVLGVANVTIGGSRGKVIEAVAVEVAAGETRSVPGLILQRQVEVAGDVGLDDVPWQVRRRVAGGKAQRGDETPADRLALHRRISRTSTICPLQRAAAAQADTATVPLAVAVLGHAGPHAVAIA